jgi:hypothetical protein
LQPFLGRGKFVLAQQYGSSMVDRLDADHDGLIDADEAEGKR